MKKTSAKVNLKKNIMEVKRFFPNQHFSAFLDQGMEHIHYSSPFGTQVFHRVFLLQTKYLNFLKLGVFWIQNWLLLIRERIVLHHRELCFISVDVTSLGSYSGLPAQLSWYTTTNSHTGKLFNYCYCHFLAVWGLTLQIILLF